jgi:ankyrin repeat protein
MKTQVTNHTLKGALMIAILAFFTMSSCDNKSSENNEVVKAPEMDILAATFMGNERAVKGHIAAKSDLNRKDEYGSTPLSIAITFGKARVAKLLIDGGADINLTTADGSTPLHTAAFFGHTEIVELLLAKGIDTNVKNNYQVTALEASQIPFEDVQLIYDQIGKELGALGLKMRYDKIKAARPVIAEMIRNAQ